MPRHLGSVGSQVLFRHQQSHGFIGLSSTISMCFSVRHFPNLSCVVLGLPYFSVLAGMLSCSFCLVGNPDWIRFKRASSRENEKTCLWVSDQDQHKPNCTVTEDD